MLVGLLFAAGLAIGGAGVAAPAHPNSFSISEIHVRGARVEVQLRCQVLSLGEVIEGLDPELDGHAEPGEIERFAAEISGYVAAHYRLVAGAEDVADGAAPERALQVRDALVVEAPLALDPMNEVSEWVDVVLRYEAEGGAMERLGVRQELFQVTSPGHRDSCAVVWNGVELEQRQFALGAEGHVFVATQEALDRGAPAFGRYLRASARRLAGEADALLLAVLLVLAARPGLRSGLLSLTLLAAAVAMGVQVGARMTVSPTEGRFLQLTVPLAIAYIGLDDLLHRDGRTRFIEPVVFGLALGGREVVALAPELVREAGPAAPLAGASAGLAVALVAAGALALGLVRAAGGSLPPGAAAAPRPARVVADALAIGLGLWLFLGRALG